MFTMREASNELDRIVKTVHLVKLNSAIKSEADAKKDLEDKTKEHTAKLAAYNKAKEVTKAAAANVVQGEKDREDIKTHWNGEIQKTVDHHVEMVKALNAAKLEQTAAHAAVVEAKAGLAAT